MVRTQLTFSSQYRSNRNYRVTSQKVYYHWRVKLGFMPQEFWQLLLEFHLHIKQNAPVFN